MELLNYEAAHLQELRGLLPECMVLLKKNGDFPLEGPQEIALYGSGVRRTVKGGTGSGEVNSRFFVNVEDGLKEAGFTITSGAWLDAYEEVMKEARVRFLEDIRREARKQHMAAAVVGMGAVMKEPEYELPLDAEGDTALYVLSRNSGEGNDRKFERGDILLTETEVRDILAANEKYERFMLVLNTGGPVDLSPVLEVKNILVLSQLGVETGSALADVLLGHAAPSGKLTTTWAASEDYPEMIEFGGLNDTHYREGIYVGYRYFNTVGKKPLFPFGFGLSYTDFRLDVLGCWQDGKRIRAAVRVENVGAYAGKEVVQAYVSCPQGKLDREAKQLAGFIKSHLLAPGESEELIFDFLIPDLAGYDTEAAAYILEAGDYVLSIGNSSEQDEPAAVFTIPETLTVLQAKNVLGTPDFEDWKPEPRIRVIPEGLYHFAIDTACIPCGSVEYDREYETDPEIRALVDEELAYMNIGAFNPKGGMLSVVGNASGTVPGAAGETTGVLKARNIPLLVMSDGPAGLRLTRDYMQDEKGIYTTGPMIPESMLDFLPKAAVSAMKLFQKKAPEGAEEKHIYASALPIGTAIAESWNPDLAYRCGDIVGDEMERFGIHLWLAPALNIHRSIRCGRNFEYFSEDPFISGVFAAAITNGVQKHPGCSVTIKHYAANNQETNRYYSNSQVSERAMREIYLKGFGIAVRDGHPHAVMTSYNLLNGIHTSENRGLIEDILRAEFGFTEVVMTDWIIGSLIRPKEAVYHDPKSTGIAAAGGDLVMPGSPAYYKELLASLKNGSIERKQVEINATRVLRLARKLKGERES